MGSSPSAPTASGQTPRAQLLTAGIKLGSDGASRGRRLRRRRDRAHTSPPSVPIRAPSGGHEGRGRSPRRTPARTGVEPLRAQCVVSYPKENGTSPRTSSPSSTERPRSEAQGAAPTESSRPPTGKVLTAGIEFGSDGVPSLEVRELSRSRAGGASGFRSRALGHDFIDHDRSSLTRLPWLLVAATIVPIRLKGSP